DHLLDRAGARLGSECCDERKGFLPCRARLSRSSARRDNDDSPGVSVGIRSMDSLSGWHDASLWEATQRTGFIPRPNPSPRARPNALATFSATATALASSRAPSATSPFVLPTASPGVAGAVNQPLVCTDVATIRSQGKGKHRMRFLFFLGALNTHLALCFVDERQVKDVNSSPSYRCAQDKVR